MRGTGGAVINDQERDSCRESQSRLRGWGVSSSLIAGVVLHCGEAGWVSSDVL